MEPSPFHRWVPLTAGLSSAAPASAAWRAGSPDVVSAARDSRIAGALARVDLIDDAAVRDDHAAFAAPLADDPAVNTSQNGVSVRGATTRRNAAGQISHARYDRIIDHAGRRGDMVILMGEEIVLPKEPGAAAPRAVHRRFTDPRRAVAGGWKLIAREATIIAWP